MTSATVLLVLIILSSVNTVVLCIDDVNTSSSRAVVASSSSEVTVDGKGNGDSHYRMAITDDDGGGGNATDNWLQQYKSLIHGWMSKSTATELPPQQPPFNVKNGEELGRISNVLPRKRLGIAAFPQKQTGEHFSNNNNNIRFNKFPSNVKPVDGLTNGDNKGSFISSLLGFLPVFSRRSDPPPPSSMFFPSSSYTQVHKHPSQQQQQQLAHLWRPSLKLPDNIGPRAQHLHDGASSNLLVEEENNYLRKLHERLDAEINFGANLIKSVPVQGIGHEYRVISGDNDEGNLAAVRSGYAQVHKHENQNGSGGGDGSAGDEWDQPTVAVVMRGEQQQRKMPKDDSGRELNMPPPATRIQNNNNIMDNDEAIAHHPISTRRSEDKDLFCREAGAIGQDDIAGMWSLVHSHAIPFSRGGGGGGRSDAISSQQLVHFVRSICMPRQHENNLMAPNRPHLKPTSTNGAHARDRPGQGSQKNNYFESDSDRTTIKMEVDNSMTQLRSQAHSTNRPFLSGAFVDSDAPTDVDKVVVSSGGSNSAIASGNSLPRGSSSSGKPGESISTFLVSGGITLAPDKEILKPGQVMDAELEANRRPPPLARFSHVSEREDRRPPQRLNAHFMVSDGDDSASPNILNAGPRPPPLKHEDVRQRRPNVTPVLQQLSAVVGGAPEETAYVRDVRQTLPPTRKAVPPLSTWAPPTTKILTTTMLPRRRMEPIRRLSVMGDGGVPPDSLTAPSDSFSVRSEEVEYESFDESQEASSRNVRLGDLHYLYNLTLVSSPNATSNEIYDIDFGDHEFGSKEEASEATVKPVSSERAIIKKPDIKVQAAAAAAPNVGRIPSGESTNRIISPAQSPNNHPRVDADVGKSAPPFPSKNQRIKSPPDHLAVVGRDEKKTFTEFHAPPDADMSYGTKTPNMNPGSERNNKLVPLVTADMKKELQTGEKIFNQHHQREKSSEILDFTALGGEEESMESSTEPVGAESVTSNYAEVATTTTEGNADTEDSYEYYYVYEDPREGVNNNVAIIGVGVNPASDTRGNLKNDVLHQDLIVNQGDKKSPSDDFTAIVITAAPTADDDDEEQDRMLNFANESDSALTTLNNESVDVVTAKSTDGAAGSGSTTKISMHEMHSVLQTPLEGSIELFDKVKQLQPATDNADEITELEVNYGAELPNGMQYSDEEEGDDDEYNDIVYEGNNNDVASNDSAIVLSEEHLLDDATAEGEDNRVIVSDEVIDSLNSVNSNLRNDRFAEDGLSTSELDDFAPASSSAVSKAGVAGTSEENTQSGISPEKLAYILIGVCCGLSLLCLVIVGVSIGCKSETHYRLDDGKQRRRIRLLKTGSSSLSSGSINKPLDMMETGGGGADHSRFSESEDSEKSTEDSTGMKLGPWFNRKHDIQTIDRKSNLVFPTSVYLTNIDVYGMQKTANDPDEVAAVTAAPVQDNQSLTSFDNLRADPNLLRDPVVLMEQEASTIEANSARRKSGVGTYKRNVANSVTTSSGGTDKFSQDSLKLHASKKALMLNHKRNRNKTQVAATGSFRYLPHDVMFVDSDCSSGGNSSYRGANTVISNGFENSKECNEIQWSTNTDRLI